MRVALVSAPYDTQAYRIGENLGLKYVAAALDADDIPTDVYDPALSGLGTDELVGHLAEGSYDLVGISVMFDSAVPAVMEIVDGLREQNCRAHITAGGHVPTFNHIELLRDNAGLDSVIRFEGDVTIVELVRALRCHGPLASIAGLTYRSPAGIRANPPRHLVADLDDLPFPRRDPTSRHLGDPHFFVVTTRGCPFNCTFCSIPAFYREPAGKQWRTRSTHNVLDELEYLATHWGATTISFLDDEFLVGENGKERAVELADALAASGMNLTWSFECRADDVAETLFRRLQRCGLRHVFLGI